MESMLRYSSSHTWARTESDGTVTVGITAFAQYELGELQYVGLPRVGSAVTKDAAFGEVESAKTVSDLYAPCSGTVIAVNSEVIGDPAVVNRDPFGAGWIIRVEPSQPRELDSLVDAAAYEALVAGQER
ncbi:MAG TPA: glycine cleavage system protein GcvH [Candidatus Aquilonibacter sp.]